MFWLSVLFAVFQSSDPRPAGPPVPALLAQHPCADSEGCNRTIRGSGESQTKSSMQPAHPSSYMKVPVHRYCCPVTELHCKQKVVYSSTWTKGNIRSQVCAPGLVQFCPLYQSPPCQIQSSSLLPSISNNLESCEKSWQSQMVQASQHLSL